MKKLAIYGGTFNPVHNEHVKVIENLNLEFKFDKIMVIPSFITPLKDSFLLASGSDRLNMLKLAFNDADNVEVSDYEVLKGGNSYTYETILHFANLYKDYELYFIMGADSFATFYEWKNPEIITQNAKIIYFLRDGFDYDIDSLDAKFFNTYGERAIRAKYIGKNVSSTKIRVNKAFKLSCANYLNNDVEKYIDANNLYLSPYFELLKSVLKETRIKHTAGVVYAALTKYKELGLNISDVIVACTLHDIAKYMSVENFSNFTIPSDMPEPVVHSKLGAHFIETVLKIDNADIINAVKFHTTGRVNMSNLEKLVFLADMVEDGRDYAGVDTLREFFKGDIDFCMFKCLEEEILHLKNKGGVIYKDTLDAYDYYKNLWQVKNGKC